MSAVDIGGVDYRTECQWERVHRHVSERWKGRGVTRRWRSPVGNVEYMYYCRKQTRKWTKAEVNRERRERIEAQEAAERLAVEQRVVEAERRGRERGRLEAMEEAVAAATGAPEGKRADIDRRHTAWQWIDMGFVPIDEARWHPVRYEIGTYYYCGPWDVRWDEGRAAELAETGPAVPDRLPDGRPYDGHPWW